jgi:hypothetical protein
VCSERTLIGTDDVLARTKFERIDLVGSTAIVVTDSYIVVMIVTDVGVTRLGDFK